MTTDSIPTAHELRERAEALLEYVRATSPLELSPSERLHEYVEQLATEYGTSDRPQLTLIRGGHEDA